MQNHEINRVYNDFHKSPNSNFRRFMPKAKKKKKKKKKYRSNFGEVDVAPAKNNKVNKVEK